MTAARVPEHREEGLVAQAAFALVLVGAASLAVAFSPRLWGAPGFDYLTAGAFAVGFFVLRLLALKLPQGDEVPITVMAGLCALSVLDAPEVIATAGAIGLIDAAVRSTQAPGRRSVRRFLDVLRSTAVLAILVPLQPFVRLIIETQDPTDVVLLPVIAVGLGYALLDVLTISAQERLAGGASVWQGVQLLIRPLGTVYLVHIAMAAVVLRVYPALGMWSFAIAVLMTIILQNSFNLYLRIRRAYGDTIEALAHAAELDRPQDAGHAQRVTDLSIAVGRRMGLSSHDLEHLRYASLLHDLGRIGHAEGDDQDDAHAMRGAEIVDQIAFLKPVAPLIGAHHRRDGDDVPPGALIIGVCSRYDRLRMRVGAPAALATLRSDEAGTRSAVVAELAEVLALGTGVGELRA